LQSTPSTLLILGTGGTIAGSAADAHDVTGYRAGQIDVARLLAGLPVPAGWAVEAEQLAQIDSKDIGHALWATLVRRIEDHLRRAPRTAVVVTHGTDTLEETGYLLQRVLAPDRPVVLTAAMRPATALLADGPQNLVDAMALAAHDGARGVLAVLAGQVFAGAELRKLHSHRLDAFGAGERGPIGVIEAGRLRRWRDWPGGEAFGSARLPLRDVPWPRVDIVTSHAGSDGRIVDALLDSGVQGLVVAGVGNGHVHAELQAALRRARARGVPVALCTRCAGGVVLDADGNDDYGALTPVQARIEMMLRLLAAA
jgi:L-asparaginase